MTADDVVRRHELTFLQQSIPEMARRAVPASTVRLASVIAPMSAGQCSVLVDGDSDPMIVTNATGAPLPPAARVVVLFYPPSGVMVLGLVAPTMLDQSWSQTVTGVPSHATTSNPVNGAWDLGNVDGLGWIYAGGGEMECVMPGWWDVSLYAQWSTDGGGTHRAAGLRIVGAGANFLNVSHQFSAPGGVPTVGYGLSSASTLGRRFAEGDRVEAIVRQDSGGLLDVELSLSLRWVGP